MRNIWLNLSVLFAGVLILACLAAEPAWLATTIPAVPIEPDAALLVEYPVPGNPESLVVEVPGRIWFTLPPQNLIGRLTVTSTTDYSVVTYTVPTPNSYPYDVDWADGAVWFTEHHGNKIGRLDADTGAITEYAVPTAGSAPTGIDVLAGSPTQVWFVERDVDNLGTLVYTNTTSFEMREVALPTQYAGAELQDVSVRNTNEIWFTAPGRHSIARYLPGTYDPFDFQWVRVDGVDGMPWSIETATTGVAAWFTDSGLNSVGAYFPQTISNYLWYDLPTDNSSPNGLAVTDQYVWCTAELGERVVRVTRRPHSVGEYRVGNGALGGIDADSSGDVWFAERDAGAIGQWRPPYFHSVYLPLVARF